MALHNNIANAFNKFFTSVGPGLAENLTASKSNYRDWMKIPATIELRFNHVSSFSMLDHLYKLDCSKAVGADDIPIYLLKKVAEYVYEPLTSIYNTCIDSSTFPDSLKIAKVIPLFKDGDRELASNYRPISLLPTISKIFEKLICDSLVYHLESNHLLFDYQFGFRKKRNTALAITDFVSRIIDAFENGQCSMGVFLDLSKAFDTVNHDILINKLNFYGITGHSNKLFQSYLENRKQFVNVNGVDSNLLPLTCGVSQGSILGPILFLIYVNDAQFVTRAIHLLLYADDMNLLYKHKEIERMVSVINEELESLYDWLLANKLSVNLSKTKFVLFGTKNKLLNISKNFPHIPLKLSGQYIERETHTKFLGVIIDEEISWNRQIEYVTHKISKNIGILYKVRHYLSLDILLNLYYNLIYPYISYCTLIWGSNYKSKLDPIHILQKRALRAITLSERRSASRPIFKKLEVLNIFEIVDYQLAELAFRYSVDQLPDIFSSYFTDLTSLYPYETRSKSSKNFHLPRPNLNHGKFGLKYASAKVWNSVPTGLKDCTSLKLFKRLYKKHIVYLY